MNASLTDPQALISICIPTYQRRAMLEEAILSCLASVYRPLEILVGDDSQNDETRLFAEALALPEGVSLRYQKRTPPLGQAGNVNDLFDQASGARIIVLHDDDLLCLGGIDALDTSWKKHVAARCVYGKQYIVRAAGSVLERESAELNRTYSREARHAGVQESGLEAGLLQQMPNNCFLIDAELARAVRYRGDEKVGTSVDADFAIRAGLAAGPRTFVFIDKFISKYRLSEDSIQRSGKNHGRHLFYATAQKLNCCSLPEKAAQEGILSRLALEASLDAATAGQRRMALRILFSRHYDKPWLSRWTLLRLLSVASPALGRKARQSLRR